MANFRSGSRFSDARTGVFKDKEVIYPLSIDYDNLEYLGIKTIQAGEVFRPDLISYNVYGRDDLGWFIMGSNNIDSIEDLYEGRSLRILSFV